jgi:hypothetical protein
MYTRKACRSTNNLWSNMGGPWAEFVPPLVARLDFGSSGFSSRFWRARLWFLAEFGCLVPGSFR